MRRNLTTTVAEALEAWWLRLSPVPGAESPGRVTRVPGNLVSPGEAHGAESSEQLAPKA